LSPPLLNARTLIFEFEVEDTGPGIPPAQQKKVFEPFVQGDLGLSKKYGGTGLGLSICSQLATLMKGTINLQSVEGQGSTFTMRIPLKFIKERADSTASSSVHGSHRNSLNHDPSQPHTPHTPKRAGSDSDLSVHSAPPPGATLGAAFDQPASKPRLVGLSQPFFATSPPLETPKAQLEAMERVAAEATRSGGKVRVLVAEDNKVNQEVVLRMLKLEEIYGKSNEVPQCFASGYHNRGGPHAWMRTLLTLVQTSRSQKMAKKHSTWSRSPWHRRTSTRLSSWTYRCPTWTACSRRG
jgi:osomolarity two-component system sensor histidine kinase SLN1